MSSRTFIVRTYHYRNIVLFNDIACSVCHVVYGIGTKIGQYSRFCPCCVLLICEECSLKLNESVEVQMQNNDLKTAYLQCGQQKQNVKVKKNSETQTDEKEKTELQ